MPKQPGTPSGLFIPLYESLYEHPKLEAAADALGFDPLYLTANLGRLWTWAIKYAPDGDLTGYTTKQIARAARWTWDADAFVDALVNCGGPGHAGFLERDQDGNLSIHDQHHYGGKLVQSRQSNADYMRDYRARQIASDARPGEEPPPADPSPAPENVSLTLGLRKNTVRPYVSPQKTLHHTTPEETRTDDTTLQESASPVAKRGGSRKRDTTLTQVQLAVFEPWWAIYPKHVDRKSAEDQWGRVNGEGALTEEIMTGTRTLLTARHWSEPKYWPDPPRFLRDKRWRDEPTSRGKVDPPLGEATDPTPKLRVVSDRTEQNIALMRARARN